MSALAKYQSQVVLVCCLLTAVDPAATTWCPITDTNETKDFGVPDVQLAISSALGIDGVIAHQIQLLEYRVVSATDRRLLLVWRLSEDGDHIRGCNFSAISVPQQRTDTSQNVVKLHTIGKFRQAIQDPGIDTALDSECPNPKADAEVYLNKWCAFKEDWKLAENFLGNPAICPTIFEEEKLIRQKWPKLELFRFWIVESPKKVVALYTCEVEADAQVVIFQVNDHGGIEHSVLGKDMIYNLYARLTECLENELAFIYGWTTEERELALFNTVLAVGSLSAPWLPAPENISLYAVRDSNGRCGAIYQCTNGLPVKAFFVAACGAEVKHIGVLGTITDAALLFSSYVKFEWSFKEYKYSNGVGWICMGELKAVSSMLTKSILPEPGTFFGEHEKNNKIEEFGILPSNVGQSNSIFMACIWSYGSKPREHYAYAYLTSTAVKLSADAPSGLENINKEIMICGKSKEAETIKEELYISLRIRYAGASMNWTPNTDLQEEMTVITESIFLPYDIPPTPVAFWKNGDARLVILKYSRDKHSEYTFAALNKFFKQLIVTWVGNLSSSVDSTDALAFTRACKNGENYATTHKFAFQEKWVPETSKTSSSAQLLTSWKMQPFKEILLYKNFDTKQGFYFASCVVTTQQQVDDPVVYKNKPVIAILGTIHPTICDVLNELKYKLENPLLFTLPEPKPQE